MEAYHLDSLMVGGGGVGGGGGGWVWCGGGGGGGGVFVGGVFGVWLVWGVLDT